MTSTHSGRVNRMLFKTFVYLMILSSTVVPRNRLAIRGQDWICVLLETYVMIAFHDMGQIINLILLNSKVAYTNVGGGHCANDCVFRWCDGPCSKLTVPGESNSFSYFDDIPTTGNLWGKRDHMEKIIMAQFRYDTGECHWQPTRICRYLPADTLPTCHSSTLQFG